VISEVEREDADQHQQAADRSVDEKLHRSVDATLATPDSDQEEHRHQRRFEEQVEEQQIERHEDADHRRFQDQQERVVRELSLVNGGPTG